MFVISQKSTYVWPVEVHFPIDGGKTDRQTFDGVFKRMSQSRINAIRDRIEKSEITDTELAAEVLADWSGVNDGNGEPVPFSERARDQLLDVPLVASAVVMAWLQSLTGAKRKN